MSRAELLNKSIEKLTRQLCGQEITRLKAELESEKEANDLLTRECMRLEEELESLKSSFSHRQISRSPI